MRGIRKSFGATQALGGVDFAVAPGEVVALVGENGAGKSTLMKVLAGAHAPDAGVLHLDGQPYRPSSPQAARAHGVAMVYQELSLVPHLSVEENILLGAEPARWGILRRARMRERAREALARVGHPEIDPAQQARTLSVGNQQLVEIARALAVGSRVLVLDEPTSSLPREDVTRLFALVDALKRQRIGIVYISHFIEEVQRVADRVVVLRDGQTVGEGPAAELTPEQIVSMMVGRAIGDLYPKSKRVPGEVVLRVHQLAGRYLPKTASLELRRGEILGIAGLIGAGRTELLRTIFGLQPVRRGEVRVKAWSGSASPAQRWRQDVGMLSEDRKGEGLALNLSVADNVTLSRLGGLGPLRLVLPTRQRAASRTWIDRLDIRCRHAGQPVTTLSGGNQQKVAFARLLHHDVDVLLLDEPTRGIDVGSKQTIYRVIDALASGEGGRTPCAVLMVSSYLPELLGVCDRVAVMHRGRLGAVRPVEEVDEHALMLEATGALQGGSSGAR
jgi:ribose transport system ATP-binding protein